MNSRRSFDEVLSEAIDAVQGGAPLDEVLAAHPEYRGQLGPLLETATALDPNGAFMPPTSRLQANLSVVHRALADARGTASSRGRAKAWWQRRITFASLSLPAGVFAFALLGAGGAAATVAASTNLPSQIGDAAEQLTPAWSHSILPGGGDDGSGAQPLATAEVAADATEAPSTPPPSEAPVVGQPMVASPSAVPSVPGLQSFAADGVITKVRGNTFDFADGIATFKIQLDSRTIVSGTVEAGAGASVEGTLTGNGVVHATRVTITATPDEPDPTPEPAGDDEPAKTHTPPGQVDKTKTPPGQTKTKTPGAQGEPNGNGEDHGGGNGNSNGDGNGNGNGNGP